MKRKLFLFSTILLLLSACSLAEDVTPPPDFPTRQPEEQGPQATLQRAESTEQATAVEETATPESDQDPGEGDPEQKSGTIFGYVENGTEGAAIPSDLEVTLFAIDGNQIAAEVDVAVESDGTFEVRDQELVPGRVFGAVTQYLGVQYFNTARMLEDNLSLELPLTIYEKTTDDGLIVIERTHLIFDFSIEGVVEVSELLLITNTGDHTIDGKDEASFIHITLPEGFNNLRFADPPEMTGFSEDLLGFEIKTAIIPGEVIEAFYSFMLPYDRSLDFRQLANYPIDALVVLKPEGPPSVSGEGLMDLDVRDMGGSVMESYRLEPMEQGDIIELRFSGRHPASEGITGLDSLIIGAAVLGLAIFIIIVSWRMWFQRTGDTDEGKIEAVSEEPRDREALIRAIAALDEMNDAGELSSKEYMERRSALKRKLVTLMESEND